MHAWAAVVLWSAAASKHGKCRAGDEGGWQRVPASINQAQWQGTDGQKKRREGLLNTEACKEKHKWGPATEKRGFCINGWHQAATAVAAEGLVPCKQGAGAGRRTRQALRRGGTVGKGFRGTGFNRSAGMKWGHVGGGALARGGRQVG